MKSENNIITIKKLTIAKTNLYTYLQILSVSGLLYPPNQINDSFILKE